MPPPGRRPWPHGEIFDVLETREPMASVASGFGSAGEESHSYNLAKALATAGRRTRALQPWDGVSFCGETSNARFDSDLPRAWHSAPRSCVLDVSVCRYRQSTDPWARTEVPYLRSMPWTERDSDLPEWTPSCGELRPCILDP